jgi:hypothetical protein
MSSSLSESPQQLDHLFRIGFITPPFKDNKIPVTDHLHAHAYIMPADLMGWWRGIAYGPLAWYAIDDLIAEIRSVPPFSTLSPSSETVTAGLFLFYFRESVSNNRVKSGYENRSKAPIDLVPSAGARSGTADGRETTEPGLVSQGESSEESQQSSQQPSPLILPQQSLSLATQNQIPQLSV